jgi:hypothetical protein
LNNYDLLPTKETATLLKDYEIKVRSIQGGVLLIGSNSDRFNGAGFNNELVLQFVLIINDALFLNYTDIDFNIDKRLYFSNDYNALYLHEATYVNDSNLTDEYFGKGIKGLIQLKINSNQEFFGEGANKKNKTIEYLINFNSRKAINRFNLIGRISEEHLNEFYVEDDQKNKLELVFMERELSSGRVVYSAILSDNFLLREKLSQRFYLKKKDQTFHNYSKFIPNPEIRNLSLDQTSGMYISDVFINIK